MTLRQIIATAIIGTFVTIAACTQIFVLGESRPPGPAGKRLQIELHAYVDSFTKRLDLTAEKMQWAVLVLPVMEMRSPAVTYGWGLPPPPEKTEIWMGIFTFDQDWMLQFSPGQRRVIAAHEVGHMVETCIAIKMPDTTYMTDIEAAMKMYNYRVLNESCADIVSARLTNPEGVLELLHDLLNKYSFRNPIIIERIRVIKEYEDQIREAPLP